MIETTLKTTDFKFPAQTDFQRGSVRDIYTINDNYLIMVVTDRISAFDFVLPVTIPGKGQVLAQLAVHFLRATSDIISNWLIESPDPNVVIGYKCQPYKIEMIIRGYLSGHAWREYASGVRKISGVALPEGLHENDKLPEPIITPSTHAESGHDLDIAPDQIIAQSIIPKNNYLKIEEYTHKLYKRGVEMAGKRGLILGDTKYEFGLKGNQIMLMDEVHTPDSSRYYYQQDFDLAKKEKRSPKQLSKEFVREWLIAHNFQGQAGQVIPDIPKSFITQTSERYKELYEALTGEKIKVLAESTNPSDRINNNIKKALEKLH